MALRLVAILVVLLIVYLLFGKMLSKPAPDSDVQQIQVDTGGRPVSDDPLKRPLDQTRAVLDKVRKNASEQP